MNQTGTPRVAAGGAHVIERLVDCLKRIVLDSTGPNVSGGPRESNYP